MRYPFKKSILIFCILLAIQSRISQAQETETIVDEDVAAEDPAPQCDNEPIEEIEEVINLDEDVIGTETEDVPIEKTEESQNDAPVQAGPFIDLLGPVLLSLEMKDSANAELKPHYTNDALRGKKVVGLYFSADWCGPCRNFTPELVSFYNKMNNRRGRKDEFEIVWISRCRDVNSYGQYFAHMGGWYAIPPEEAMGQRGQMLGDKYKVKGIPSLVLLDELGNVITTDARNKIPKDKAGIGFPWRNPIASLYMTIFPKTLRLMIKSQVDMVKGRIFKRAKSTAGLKK